MDSLVANYASSDEEEEKSHDDSTASLFSSVPPPKTCSLFSQPKKQQQHEPSKPYNHNNNNNNTAFTTPVQSLSLFSSLPPPKSNHDSFIPQPKRVVQFKPPSLKPQNFDDDDDDNNDKEQKQCLEIEPSSFSVKSFLSSIPAPRNSSTLGVAHTGSGRRSIIETETPHSEPLVETLVAADYHVSYETGVYSGKEGSYANYSSYDSEIDPNGGVSYGQYKSEYRSSNWTEGAGETAVAVESTFRPRGKRGRNEIPIEIVEVKQDELMKDRPREDQVKLTGIAFGPSYQPVSNKGKPSKIHKRKHQIGTLYFDMKQKEMELQERRAKGFLTKAETHAKYGW